MASQIQAKTGASTITKTGCTDWNQLAGKAKPKMVQLVPRSAKRLSEEPACSKAAQKRAEEMNSTRMAAQRLRSTGDQFPKKISHENTTTEMPSSSQPCPSESMFALISTTPLMPSAARTATTAAPMPMARMALFFSRRSLSGSPVEAGCRPAEPRCRLVTRYWMTPASMPSPAMPKPRRQLMRSPT